MRFEYPYLLNLLVLIVPLVRLVHIRRKRQLKRFSEFAQEKFYPHYYRRLSPFYSGLKSVMLILSFSFLILALARPQWDYETQNIQSRSLDIIFGIDISQSMDATDISPSRLTRAKLQISTFLEELKGDRVGIIAFAGNATLECPLTDDYDSVHMVLNSLSTNMATKLGTDIGAAMRLTAEAFNTAEGNNILVLISDGEDLEGSAQNEARKLASLGITIYTMGVGSEGGSSIINPSTGEEVRSALDAAGLSRIAQIGGGTYFAVSPGQSEISALLGEIFGKVRSRVEGRTINLYKEQYSLFLLLSLAFLLIEMLINPYRKEEVSDAQA